MNTYEVTIDVIGTETYEVKANSAEEARENWVDGTFVFRECVSTEGVKSVELTEEGTEVDV